MTIIEILRGAADYLDEHGWIQEQFVNDANQACALGAMKKVANVPLDSMGFIRPGASNTPEFNTYFAATEALGRCLAADYGFNAEEDDVATWNDARGRTKTEVTAELRACADRLEASEGS